MSLISGTANVPLVKRSLRKFTALGEKATGDDFRMVVDGYPDLEFLVQSVQMPPAKREMVEIVGPHGVQVQQQGKIMNAHEIPVTFIETVEGDALKAIRQWVKNKEYHTVNLALVSEESPNSNEWTSVTLEGCWIESEGIELSVEDNAPLKPTGTLHANWVSYFDEAGNLLSW